ncbi:Glutathione S-transferase S1 [Linnemannia zychae]|nr:Glutathione S-transferase S1 [Linnemannia zychae]
MTRAKLDLVSNNTHPTSAQKAEMLKADNKDLSFTLLYWDIASVGSTSRELLVYGKANYDFTFPKDEDWDKGKVPTVFSVVPVLTIKGGASSKFAGQEMHLAESSVIDTFLAGRFGLLGENEWESLAIQSFYSSIQYLRERCYTEGMPGRPELRKEARDKYMKSIEKFCEDHEYHLEQNGSNGHYVGNKLSLADIHLSNVIHYLSTIPWGDMALDLIKRYKLIWKVKENVEKCPEIAEWRETELFKRLEKNSIELYLSVKVPDN